MIEGNDYKLVFIRAKTICDCAEYYEEKTDVWVFSDCPGYQRFLSAIEAARLQRTDVALDPEPAEHSMELLVTRPLALKGQETVRIVERVVRKRGRTNMELVLLGTEEGYVQLVDELTEFGREAREEVDDHLHLDDQMTAFVRPRSIAINVRAPFRKWSKDALDCYWDWVYERPRHFVPRDYANGKLKPSPYEGIRSRDRVALVTGGQPVVPLIAYGDVG